MLKFNQELPVIRRPELVSFVAHYVEDLFTVDDAHQDIGSLDLRHEGRIGLTNSGLRSLGARVGCSAGLLDALGNRLRGRFPAALSDPLERGIIAVDPMQALAGVVVIADHK